MGAAERLRVLDPPFRIPAVSVATPVKLWVNPVPRFKVPFAPFTVKVDPVMFPVNVAVLPPFDIKTGPVVVKAPILWSITPVMVSPPVLVVVAPLLTRFPLIVNKKLAIFRVAPLLRVRVVPGLNVLA